MRVIVKTLEEQPSDTTHWSTRSMAAALGMSQSAIVRIWSAFGLKPLLMTLQSLPHGVNPAVPHSIQYVVLLRLKTLGEWGPARL